MNSTELQLTGVVKEALPLQGGTSKAGYSWQKKGYILETAEGNYTKSVCISVWGDNINRMSLDDHIGKRICLQIDLESREYNGNWYTEVRAVKLLETTQEAQALEVNEAKASSGAGRVALPAEDDFPF